MRKLGHFVDHLGATVRTAFVGPQMFAFLPALALGGYWFGFQGVVMFLAMLVPTILVLVSMITPRTAPRAGHASHVDPVTGLALRPALVAAMDAAFQMEPEAGARTGCLMLEIDDFDSLRGNYGPAATDETLKTVAHRIQATLRTGDLACWLEGGTFAIVLAPVRRLDLEVMIQVSARLQQAIGAPIGVGGMRLFLSVCVGFCLPRRAEERVGVVCLDAAEAALRDAQVSGAGAIRAFAPQSTPRQVKRAGLAEDVARALDDGTIRPWFQPQVNTDTGEISGMEALARWEHPDRGVILPGAFLPAISASGLSQKLGEVILRQSLTAIVDWDKAGVKVPSVSVNFSHEELADPNLTDRIRWELDKFDLAPDRLVVEILETVISRGENDMITRNIALLHDLGCGIDLDDFGTGHASIAHIRRFNVGRIKIDRGFVTRVDTDREQQALLTAILEMADRLGIETLAEGVETTGEYALLSQLGCGYVQGFSIARPMAFEDTLVWIAEHDRRLTDRPKITREAG